MRLVVVNEGPAVEVLRAEAERLDEPLTLLPFQPYERLPEVLGSADVLVVLLEQDAGEFSVPSKTLSYLCAGRPVLGLMPAENLAATLVAEADGCVLAPLDASCPTRRGVGRHPAREPPPDVRPRLAASRALAEQEFGLQACADRFEADPRRAASVALNVSTLDACPTM